MDKYIESIEIKKIIDLTKYSYENRNDFSGSEDFGLLIKNNEILEYKKNIDNVFVTYNCDGQKINVIYKYKTTDEIMGCILNDKRIDLSFHFIDELLLNKIENLQINGIEAYSSVWIGEVNFDNVHFSGKFDFSLSKFYNNVNFVSTVFDKLKVDFWRASFLKNNVSNNEINFTGAKFIETNVEFWGSIFSADCNFINVNFGDGDISFENCTFDGYILDYRASTFGDGCLLFNKSIFSCDYVSFEDVDFGNGCKYFSEVEFLSKRISFSYSKFGTDIVEFYKLKCTSNIYFNNAIFKSENFNIRESNLENCELLFLESIFYEGELWISSTNFENSKVIFNECNLEKTKIRLESSYFYEVSFKNITFEKDLSIKAKMIDNFILKNCNIKSDATIDKPYLGLFDNEYEKDNEYTYYENLSFEGTKVTGNIYIDWERNNVYNAIENYSNEKSNNNNSYNPILDKMSQYRMLKTNFNKIGYYEDEDKALVKYMDNYLLSSKNEGAKLVKLVFNKIGGYGTNPLSIILASLALIIIFALIYIFSGIDYSSTTSEIPVGFLETIYFSGITFLTIGYGDLSPATAITRIITVSEGFLGIFMMSYFSVAVVRKILR